MPHALISEEIRATPDAIRATIDETRPTARVAAGAIKARAPRRVFITGNGTSYYSSLAASYTARALAGPSDPFVLAMLSGDLRYYTPSLTEQDVIVGVSASGEFRDVIALFERLHGKALLIGITHIAGSSITKLADFTLISGGGPSQVPVMTKTYASTLTAIHLLMLEMFSATEMVFTDLAASADRAHDAIEGAHQRVPALVRALDGFEHSFYFGAGPGYAAALEGSLKMKEMALLHAEGSETWEMASGPATMVDQNTFCVALYSGGSGDEFTRDGAQKAREWGARVIEVGPDASAGDFHLRVTPPQFEPFATLSLIPPVAYLAEQIARSKGLNPDRPHWRERYHAQGMTHIIGE
jgi:glucosamine--fructose-6-phosphate aminotransferase (isomerizing)